MALLRRALRLSNATPNPKLLHTNEPVRGSSSHGAPRVSCASREPPPCPPCPPAPRPPCRRPLAACPSALRVVCCAPPRGRRPPCPHEEPACAITCDTVRTSRFDGPRPNTPETEPPRWATACGAPQDRVARRIAAAELARRRAYERGAATRAPPASPPVPAFRLAAAYSCARATDGRDYAVLHAEPASGPARCGPDRRPPPPCPLDLAPADGCTVTRDRRVDPCAHRPRIFLEIDRPAAEADTAKSPSAGGAGRPLPGAGCPRKSCVPRCPGFGAKRAGDEGWCSSLPPLAPAPEKCREPSSTESLRRRPRPSCDGKRSLHTSASAAARGRLESSGLSQKRDSSPKNLIAAILRERERANRGRAHTLASTYLWTKKNPWPFLEKLIKKIWGSAKNPKPTAAKRAGLCRPPSPGPCPPPPPCMPSAESVEKEHAPPRVPSGESNKRTRAPPCVPSGDSNKKTRVPPCLPSGESNKKTKAPPCVPSGESSKEARGPPCVPSGESNKEAGRCDGGESPHCSGITFPCPPKRPAQDADAPRKCISTPQWLLLQH